MKPVRVQLRRVKGWRMPPNTVKVDRSTRWGNPFVVQPDWEAEVLWGGGPMTPSPYAVICRPPEAWRGFVVAVRRTEEEALREAVRLFRFEAAPHLDLSPLRGKNLACWCREGAHCHADVLLELANQ